MIVSFSIVLASCVAFYQIARLGSFILIIMALAPLGQCINVFYAYYLIDDFFAEHFLHFSLMKEGDIDFFLLNFLVYLVAIWGSGKVMISFFKVPIRQLTEISINDLTFSLDRLVLIYCGVSVIFLASAELNSFISKVMRLAFYYVSFVPLLIGYFIKDIKKRTITFFAVVVLFFVAVNLLVGSRGYMAVIFVTITYGLLANRKNRNLIKPYLIGSTIVVALLFPFLGFIELFRSEHGRIAYEDIDQERIELLTSEFEDNEKYEKSGESGFARNIVWPNLSVMLMTDNQVPSIGFDNIENDIAYIFTNTFLSGKDVEEARLEYIERLWATGPANLYGYNVGISNSVEFSAMADGIWRYGKFGFIYHVVFLVIIGLTVERLLIKYASQKSVPLWLVLIAGNVFVSFITIVNGEPMISIIRALLYSSIFSALLFFGLRPFTQKSLA
jgi:hypothetical protein